MKGIPVVPILFFLLFCTPTLVDSATPVYSTSFEQIKLAAEQGDTEAQNTLAGLYSSGRGVEQDHKAALKWYKLAAKQGHDLAMYNLGDMYARGQGVTQDNIRAHMWWSLSVSQRFYEGANERDKIEMTMVPSQVEKAKKLAQECVAKNFQDC